MDQSHTDYTFEPAKAARKRPGYAALGYEDFLVLTTTSNHGVPGYCRLRVPESVYKLWGEPVAVDMEIDVANRAIRITPGGRNYVGGNKYKGISSASFKKLPTGLYVNVGDGIYKHNTDNLPQWKIPRKGETVDISSEKE
jgi:hypothetical protein